MASSIAQYSEIVRGGQVKEGQANWRWTLTMLFSRIVLFAVFQALIALALSLGGDPSGWKSSAAWWPVSVVLANAVCLALLSTLFRREGSSYAHLWSFDRKHMRGDILTVLVLMIVSGPVSYLPNLLMGNLLFGDYALTAEMFFRPLPVWAAWFSLLLFPLTQGLVELPTYFSYVMPRIEALSGRKWLAILAPVMMLAAQHMAAPLIFDARFILWRFTMFLPFALMVCLAIRWRYRLFPYLMIGHILIDLATIWFVFSISI